MLEENKKRSRKKKNCDDQVKIETRKQLDRESSKYTSNTARITIIQY